MDESPLALIFPPGNQHNLLTEWLAAAPCSRCSGALRTVNVFPSVSWNHVCYLGLLLSRVPYFVGSVPRAVLCCSVLFCFLPCLFVCLHTY